MSAPQSKYAEVTTPTFRTESVGVKLRLGCVVLLLWFLSLLGGLGKMLFVSEGASPASGRPAL